MKKLFLSLIALTAILMIVTVSCKKDASVTGITLDEQNFTLGVGETKTLIATVLPNNAANKTVTWTSSNILVATVLPNGLVTALSKGTTTIVVTTVDGGYSASCTVKVDDISVTSVTLNKHSLVLDINETETLIATVLPENATNKVVTYTSNKPHIATVEPITGTIIPIGLGTATITVTTLDGGKTDKCELEIVKKVAVTGVTLNKTQMDLGVGTTEQLTASVTPYNATNQNLSWNSSNSSIASVDGEGLVSAKAEGTVDITVTTEDGGFTAKCEVKSISFTAPVLKTLEPTNVVTDDGDGLLVSATFNGEITNVGNPPYIERGFVYRSFCDPLDEEGPYCYFSSEWVSGSGSGIGQFSCNINLTGEELLLPIYIRAYAKTSLGITYGNVVVIEY